MQLSINRTLRLADFAKKYAEEGLVQIPDVFDADTAAHIEHVLHSLPWHLVCQDDTRKNILLSPEQCGR